uniref:Nuclear receptor coactivator 4 n=1 Tax=Amphilophus citrinellus TaxID=61819 RepID=A0A3Q0R4B1_AMPCI
MKPGQAMAASGLKQCQQAQDQLEEAIGAVMKAEQQLRENTREVSLQSCVSRQQEALRCREVWLLSQIELLEQVKTETLQQQLHQLYRLRGQFDVIAHQLQNSNSSNDLNNQLTSCMEKLSSLSLTPEETPEMSFHADTRSLRQAITSFGSVTSPTHQRPQVQSCPVTAKKQKTDIADLSNWLLVARPTNSCTPIGYQSSKNPQDWLLSHKETKTSCPMLASMDFLQAWGQLRDLEAWLLQDHTPISRERSGSSCSSSFSIEKIDDSEFTATPEEEELSDWLITPPTAAMEAMSDAERWRRVFKPFEESWSSSDWLPAASRPTTDCSSCCQTISAVEIENLGQLKCLKTPPTSNPASPTSPAPTVASPVSVEAWLQQTVPTPQTCRANELCSTYSACVCEENCGREALSRWLLQQDGRDKNGVPKNAPPTAKNVPPTLFHREQEEKVQAILEAWLHPSTASSPCRTPLQALTSSRSDWVAPEEEEKASREESLTCPVEEEEEEDKWLLKKRSHAQERLAAALPTMCDLFSCMKVGGDKEKWLHRAPVQVSYLQHVMWCVCTCFTNVCVSHLYVSPVCVLQM